MKAVRKKSIRLRSEKRIEKLMLLNPNHIALTNMGIIDKISQQQLTDFQSNFTGWISNKIKKCNRQKK